jgi:hypothetical protein
VKAGAVFAAILIIGVAAILLFTATAAYQWAPFADVHDWISAVFDAERTRDWLSYAWTPHTAQRIVIARFATAIDVEMAHGRYPTFLIIGAALWLGGLACVLALLVRATLAPPAKLALVLVAALLGLNLGLAEDLALPVFSVYLFVGGPTLAALAILGAWCGEGLKSWSLWAALVLATLASVGNAAGLAAWPAVLIMLWLQGQHQKVVGVTLGAALLCGLAIEAGLGTPSTSLGAQGGGAAHLVKMGAYFLVFGGLPWSRSAHAIAVQAAIGGIVWLMAVLGAVRAWRYRGSPLVATGLAMVAFGTLAAALASVGRVDELPQPIVPTRYTPFATVLQIGVILSAAREIEALWLRRPAVALGATVVSCTLLLISIVPAIKSTERMAQRIRSASALFDRTAQQPDLIIYPRPRTATAVRAELARRGLPH